jgi:hypothetical protein
MKTGLFWGFLGKQRSSEALPGDIPKIFRGRTSATTLCNPYLPADLMMVRLQKNEAPPAAQIQTTHACSTVPDPRRFGEKPSQK